MKKSIRQSRRALMFVSLLCFSLALMLAQASFAFAAPAAAPESLPNCGWILETTGKGVSNVAYPDTGATYWTMPLDTAQWKGMIVKGKYAQARFFSFTTYVQNGAAVDSINDVKIDPNRSSSNPFRRGPDRKRHNYKVTISTEPPAPGEKNHVNLGDTRLAWITYRIYLPNQGLDALGGVPLPRVILIAQDGSRHPIPACPFKKPAVQTLLLLLELRANGFGPEADYWEIKFREGDDGGYATGSNCQPDDQLVFWIPKNTGGYFPNPANKYIAAPDLCFEPDRVVVVRGKAPVFPDTYNGGTIWEPAIPGAIQMRYWSMCNNDQVKPYPVVQCEADAKTNLDSNGFYTFVVGDGDAPSNLPAEATWLSWGLKRQPNILILRNMLPKKKFHQSVQSAIAANCVVNNVSGEVPPRSDIVAAGACAAGVMGDYYPEAVFCDKQLLLDEGWQACFE